MHIRSTELIIFRIIQGLAGGGLLSPAQAILIEIWPPAEIGMAMALFGLGAVAGPMSTLHPGFQMEVWVNRAA